MVSALPFNLFASAYDLLDPSPPLFISPATIQPLSFSALAFPLSHHRLILSSCKPSFPDHESIKTSGVEILTLIVVVSLQDELIVKMKALTFASQ